MTYRRLFCSVLPLALALVVGSCARDEDITGVPADAQVEPDAHLLGGLLQRTGLLSCTPLPPDADTVTIGWAGGEVQVGPHVLDVPRGAVTAPVTITAEILPGEVNAVRFTPQGLTFARPARLTMSYANCSLLGRLVPKRIAYVDDDLTILEYLLSLDLLRLRRVTARLDHFSSYALAW
jgi:hypothetical protein